MHPRMKPRCAHSLWGDTFEQPGSRRGHETSELGTSNGRGFLVPPRVMSGFISSSQGPKMCRHLCQTITYTLIVPIRTKNRNSVPLYAWHGHLSYAACFADFISADARSLESSNVFPVEVSDHRFATTGWMGDVWDVIRARSSRGSSAACFQPHRPSAK